MRYLVLTFSIIIAFKVNAQSVDYNTKKGFAVEGYDVISYFYDKAEKGHKDFLSTYDGVKYKFTSKEHLDIFNANPKKYIPEFGGYCAYAIATKAQKVSINPETYEIRDGKLYLFYNSWGNNTLELWKKEDPDQLTKQAAENWKKIKNK